jgi:probable lipoprotein NlpC
MAQTNRANYLAWLFFALLLSSCGTSKMQVKQKVKPPNTIAVEDLIDHAQSFLGTPYKWGGQSKKGIDCSGLIYSCFDAINLPVPRVTSELVKTGSKVAPRDLVPGDLVFFKTGKSRKKVNHVGLVIGQKDRGALFIHASTSKGVMISKLDEPYWHSTFITARRLIK